MSKPPATFFPNARNCEVRFENSSINVVGGDVITNQLGGPFGFELQQLLHYCLLGALVDSSEQYDAPQCEPETRVAMTQEIDDWGRNRDGKSAPFMWVRGGAGAGKSTLAQTIAMKYKREGLLVGSFFFSNRKANRSDGNALILTLVLQLIVIFPPIAPFVLQVIKQNPTILSASPEEHMMQLFVGPLNALDAIASPPLNFQGLPQEYNPLRTPTTPLSNPTTVVIDGLDECDDPKIQCRLLHILATAIPLIRRPLRILITSRPEAHITRSFEKDGALSAIPVHRLNLSADRDAHRDIERYLRSRFASIRQSHPFGERLSKDWPSDWDLTRLIRQSSGHFIYPSIVMAFIDDPNDFPNDRLQAVLDSTKNTSADDPLAPLDKLYQHIFSRVNEKHLPVISIFFGVLCLESRGKLEIGLHYTFPARTMLNRQTLDKILQLDEGRLDVMIQPLRSLVDIPTYSDPRQEDERGSEPTLHCLHASLFDFLLDRARSGKYHINMGMVHEAAAKFIIRYMLTGGTEICQRDISFGWQFVGHCRDAGVISDDFLRSYLQTCDFFLGPVLPDLRSLRSWLCLDFLHVVSQKDIDPSGHLRFYYLKKITQELSSCPVKHPTTCQIGDPTHGTDQVVELVLEAKKSSFSNTLDSICLALSGWCPCIKTLNENIHPDQDVIFEHELVIFKSLYGNAMKTWAIRCGPLLHFVILGEIDRRRHEADIHFITYDARGRSFKTSDTVSRRNLVGLAVSHIKKCDALLKMGDGAPWCVDLEHFTEVDGGYSSWYDSEPESTEQDEYSDENEEDDGSWW